MNGMSVANFLIHRRCQLWAFTLHHLTSRTVSPGEACTGLDWLALTLRGIMCVSLWRRIESCRASDFPSGILTRVLYFTRRNEEFIIQHEFHLGYMSLAALLFFHGTTCRSLVRTDHGPRDACQLPEQQQPQNNFEPQAFERPSRPRWNKRQLPDNNNSFSPLSPTRALTRAIEFISEEAQTGAKRLLLLRPFGPHI